ncbi:hypothetical protein SAMN05444266_102225 [Chitinophaga jiangningensis]|uniref:Lipoprotein n=1 Tax=Chitinophaga jiangningensis TaxID=1419482 RepID=A0A1M6YB81_9BACT|nr:hypothetical protein [Chitinophaga jiangningensis]SHL15189.1 hypothetical protein SAMN05444266_102225 [Chitinophaga jiangningensis]
MKYLLLLLPLGLAACGKTVRSVQQMQSSAQWTELQTLTTATTLDTLVEIAGDSLTSTIDLQCNTCKDSIVQREVYGNGLRVKAVFNTRTQQLQAKIYAEPRRVPVTISRKTINTSKRAATAQQQQTLTHTRKTAHIPWWWYVVALVAILLIIINKFSKR